MEYGLAYNAGAASFEEGEKKSFFDSVYMQYLHLFFPSQIDYLSKNCELVEISTKLNFQKSIKLGYFECKIKNQAALLVRENCLNKFEDLIRKNPHHKIFLCKNAEFFEILEKEKKKNILYLSRYLQRFFNPRANAYILKELASRIKVFFIPLLIIFISLYSGMLMYFANAVYFVQTIFKLVIFRSSLRYKCNDSREPLHYSELPIYTILIPLYREAAKVKKLLASIDKLNYPKNKLDVKLILEFDDTQTYKAIKLLDMPSYVHVIRVPDAPPKTKPKACNYAMQFATGELLVIYDAEDTPDPEQLLKAVAKYKSLDSSYACLQARLKIEHNMFDILGFLFALEYEMWFSYLLKGMSLSDLPIPLGGTSNHFKVSALKEMGLWDPYNVTEDADMGIRLNLQGYKIDMLDSYTLEEPPISTHSWMKQRVRWIKGFMITFFLYILHDKGKQLFMEKSAILVFVGFSVLSFLICPIIVVNGIFSTKGSLIVFFSEMNLLLFLVFFWSVAYLLIKTSAVKHNFFNVIIIILFPIYFILHSFAAYFAILELLCKPFRWNKTDHQILN